ncbi:helix-turn-helix transcriptional regulator [Tsuneonella sp. HG249]
MPARKHRTGEELHAWEARKKEHLRNLEIARETVKSISGHTLIRLDEAAIMMGMTKKTLREHEHERLPGFPPRVTLSPKVTGFRLKDIEGYIDSCKAPQEVEPAE